MEPGTLLLQDLLTGNTFERSLDDLNTKGFYLDEPAWKAYVFTVKQTAV
jgi:hypothetical protein